MAMRPEVSIIVPCYNYGNYLKETLESVARQTFSKWECIIIDDGSTDNTKAVASVFVDRDKRFKYLFQKNRGLSAARNRGIRAATGEFLQFLDADDLIELRKIEAHVRCLREYSVYDIVYGGARFFSTEKPQERRYSMLSIDQPWMPMVSGSGKEILASLLESNIMAVCSPLIRKSVFDSTGMFDESLPCFEDWEFWLRCALQGKYFFFLNSIEANALVRYHSESMSRNQIKMFETNLSIRKKIFSLLNDNDLNRINKNNYRLNGLALAFENINQKNMIIGVFQIIKYSLNLFIIKESIKRLIIKLSGRENAVRKKLS